MLILMVILFIILMHKLGQKGKGYREEKRQSGPTVQQSKEQAYREALQKQNIDDDLITIILPVVMNNK